MHTFLVGPYKTKDFEQTQKNLVRLQDRDTVTFKNCGLGDHHSVHWLSTSREVWDMGK